MNKKVILIYPYFCGVSGAYNRYLLLERLIKISNLKNIIVCLNKLDLVTKEVAETRFKELKSLLKQDTTVIT
mgnify:CR=1 FL=1